MSRPARTVSGHSSSLISACPMFSSLSSKKKNTKIMFGAGTGDDPFVKVGLITELISELQKEALEEEIALIHTRDNHVQM